MRILNAGIKGMRKRTWGLLQPKKIKKKKNDHKIPEGFTDKKNRKAKNISIKELSNQQDDKKNLLKKEGLLSHTETREVNQLLKKLSKKEIHELQVKEAQQRKKEKKQQKLLEQQQIQEAARLRKLENQRKEQELQETKKSFLEMYGSEIERGRPKRKVPKRGIRFTTHAFHRFHERIEKYGYSIDQIKCDIRGGWRHMKLVGPGVYEIIGSLATYTLAKDRKTFDRVILTMYMIDSQKKLLDIKY